jgi:glycosyltransferase involved in cell wall biosynthesis
MITPVRSRQDAHVQSATVVPTGEQTAAQAAVGAAAALRVALDYPLAPSLSAGRATALFCYGHCFHPRHRVTGLELVVAGRRHRPTAQRMPRLDLHRWLSQNGEDPLGHSYRSGWWATVALPAQAAGPLRLQAAVRLETGEELIAPVGEIAVQGDATVACSPAGAPVVPAGTPEVPAGAPEVPAGTIAVCMATFEPDIRLFAEQVRSLRDQTDRRWLCLISDGGSAPARLAEIRAVLDDDARFILSPAQVRLSPYRNFERALTLVPAGAELVALADQDDRWHPDKLAVLRDELGSATLVYSDQRLVTVDGRVLRDSLWHGRRHDRRNLASLLVANTAPGAAMLFRRTVLERALPFPELPGVPYHDHWLALVALASGEVAYVDRPLYDYVQHGGAIQGAVNGAGRAGAHPGRSRGWRAAYFGGYVPRKLQAQTILARDPSSLTAGQRRALRLMIAAEGSPGAFAWLALRPLRRLWGRDETLGGELALACGITWRWLLAAAVAGRERPGSCPWDASFPDPPRFEQRRLRRWRAGV